MRRVPVNGALGVPRLDVMDFLNGVVQEHPGAVSFGPGRPADRFCDVGDLHAHFDRYVAAQATAAGVDATRVLRDLGQYGVTQGLLGELVAQHLAVDEGVRVDPKSVVTTTGAQEGMALLLRVLFDGPSDVLFASDPAYVGMTGAAQVLGVDVWPVRCGSDGLDLDALEARIDEAIAAGRRPRAVYDIPDFHNPLGTCMPLAARRRLLAIAEKRGLLVIEDNAYGMFAYDHERRPTLKALDEAGVVVYLGTFAKTIYPGLRVGYVVTDQIATTGRPLAELLTKVKSFVTVNTSSVSQAVVAGVLLACEGSLARHNREKVAYYRARRDRMLACLDAAFPAGGAVTFNRPAGGFFLTVSLPFAFTSASMERCADTARYGVICTPMAYFSLAGDRDREVRLSFSYVSDDEIAEGVTRLARFVADERR